MQYTVNFLVASCLYLTMTNAIANDLLAMVKQGSLKGKIHSVLSISSTPADALAEAGIDSSAKAGSTALSLFYQSGVVRGWRFGGRLQAGVDWQLHDKNSGSTLVGGEDDPRITADGINLQNLYLNYDFAHWGSRTSVVLGRQDMVSPLLMRAGVFPMMDAFEGVVLTNQDLTDTKIQLMVFDRWFKRDGTGDQTVSIVDRHIRFKQPVWSLYVNSTGIDNWILQGQWLSNNNDHLIGDPPTTVATFGGYKVLYLAADHQLPASIISVGGQFKATDYNNIPNANLYGMRVQINPQPYSLEFSYTKHSEKANSPGTLGHVPWFSSYNFTVSVNDIYAGVSTLNAKIHYDFDTHPINLSLQHSLMSHTELGQRVSGRNLDNARQTALDLRYRFTELSGVFLRLKLAYTSYDSHLGDSDFWFSRLNVNYDF